MDTQQTQSNLTIWILALIVVLALGVLIGINLKSPAGIVGDQQGAVTTSQYQPVKCPVDQILGADGYCHIGILGGSNQKQNATACQLNIACKEANNPVTYCDHLYPCATK